MIDQVHLREDVDQVVGDGGGRHDRPVAELVTEPSQGEGSLRDPVLELGRLIDDQKVVIGQPAMVLPQPQDAFGIDQVNVRGLGQLPQPLLGRAADDRVGQRIAPLSDFVGPGDLGHPDRRDDQRATHAGPDGIRQLGPDQLQHAARLAQAHVEQQPGAAVQMVPQELHATDLIITPGVHLPLPPSRVLSPPRRSRRSRPRSLACGAAETTIAAVARGDDCLS